MSKIKDPHADLIQTNPEVKAHIYQIITEFEPYVTPETVVAVLAKDPLKVYEEIVESGEGVSKQDLKTWFRISITLKEGNSKIEAEAVHKNIFKAITLAKNKLLKHLAEVHDSVISNQERIEAINMALSNTTKH